MASELPIRIFSDLHLGHPASLVRQVGQIEPLLEGMKGVIFNGDTIELRLKAVEAKALEAFDELRELCHSLGIKAIFINGNHDPEVSERNHLDLLNGEVFVTHGHALFPSITPWGGDAATMAENYRRALKEMAGESAASLEQRLEAATLACVRTPFGVGRPGKTRLSCLGGMFRELAHPSRSLAVLHAWATTPDRAAKFASEYHPEGRFFILGHTHYAGCWKRDGKLILNTGAFFPRFSRRIVDVTEKGVLMRKVQWDPAGDCFRPGGETSSWRWRSAEAISGTPLARSGSS